MWAIVCLSYVAQAERTFATQQKSYESLLSNDYNIESAKKSEGYGKYPRNGADYVFIFHSDNL